MGLTITEVVGVVGVIGAVVDDPPPPQATKTADVTTNIVAFKKQLLMYSPKYLKKTNIK